MIIQSIKDSFLFTQEQKEYLIRIIKDKDEDFINNLLEILQNEKSFMIWLLKEYKNKNVFLWDIKNELISQNLKKLKKLELNEKEISDLETKIEYIY